MKKIILILFSICFLLTGCSKKQEQVDQETKPSSPITTPTYTNEEIRLKLKSTIFEYQNRIKSESQFQLTGEFNAPDGKFNGMHVYKNLNFIADTQPSDPYLQFKADVYLKEDNKIKEVPDKRIDIIKKTEQKSIYQRDSVDYVLENYVDEKNKTYSKTVSENGGPVLDILVEAISSIFKEFTIDDLPNTIVYSYDNKNVSYGMKMKFKDLEGTPLSEYLNILLGFVPELNELFLQFKDEIIISLDNIKLDTPISTFNIDIMYPAMQGTFEFNIIHGSFKVSYKPFLKPDVKKLVLNNTYLKGSLGINNIVNYLEPFDDNGSLKYKAGLVIDTLSVIDITRIDINNIDIIKLLKNKKILIEASGAESIKFYNRFDGTPIDVKENTLDLGISDMVIVEIIYPSYNNHIINIKDVTKAEEDNNNPPSEEL